MSLLLIFSITGGGMGLLIFVIGWAGRRVHDHPTCRRCKYDLSGVWPREDEGGGEARCPECGSDIATLQMRRRGPVRRGLRAKRRRWVWVGLLLFLLGGGGSGVVVWPMVKAQDWQAWKPDWWLVIETQPSRPSTTVERAVRTLLERYEDDALSAGNIRNLVQRGMTAQADPNMKWLPAWGNFIEYAWYAEALTLAQKEQYARAAADCWLEVPAGFFQDDATKIGLVLQADRCGDSKRSGKWGTNGGGWCLTYFVSTGQTTLDGVVLAAPVRRRIKAYLVEGTSMSTSWPVEKLAEALGERHLEVEIALRVGVDLTVFAATGSEGEEREGLVLVLPREADYEVVAAERVVEMEAEDSLMEAAIVESVSTDFLQFIPGKSEGPTLFGALRYANLPCAIAFDVYLRDESGQEWEIAQLVDSGADSSMGYSRVQASLPGLRDGRIDLILRPNAELAQGDPGIGTIWGSEIVISDIALPTLPTSMEGVEIDDIGGG